MEPRLACYNEPGLHHGIDFLRKLVDDPSLYIHIGCVRDRHRRDMPFIAEKTVAPVLALFPLTEEAFDSRMSATKVERLAKALECEPAWWEIAQFLFW